MTRHKELFRDKTVIELGAGCGLVGFVANHIASKTIITDGNDVVLRLLDRNIEAMNKRGENDSQKCSVTPLLWGFKQNVSDLVSKCGEVDVIVGADVLLWPGYVRPLFMTIRWLLSFRPKYVHYTVLCLIFIFIYICFI